MNYTIVSLFSGCGGLDLGFRGLSLLENDMRKAAVYLEDALFIEYWGSEVCSKFDIHDPISRIKTWLHMADNIAITWKPSDFLFRDLQ